MQYRTAAGRKKGLDGSLPGIALILFFLLLFPPTLFGQSFQDDFSGYAPGATGQPRWHPVKGAWKIAGNCYRQESTDYDCATIADRYLTDSYTLEIEFEQLSGEPGAGYLFGAKSRDDLSFAHLIRFDGAATILTGYYQNGEFTGTQSVASPVTIAPGTRHTLTLAVHRKDNFYSASIDGIPVFTHAPLLYRSGFAGLQSSGGQIAFYHVTLSCSNDSDLHADLSWVRRFCLTANGDFLVPSLRDSVVRLIDPTGRLLRTIGLPSGRRGQLAHPSGVALAGDSAFYVTDGGSNSVHKFSLTGMWLSSFGQPGGDAGQFNEPVAVATDKNGVIFIVDKNNRRVEVFNRQYHFLTQFGASRLKFPEDIAIDDSLIYVLNTGVSRIDCFAWNGTAAVWRRFISYGGGEARGITVLRHRIYISNVNAIREYDGEGTELHVFIGRGVGFLFPTALAPEAEHDKIIAADYFHDRFIELGSTLYEPSSVVSAVTESSAVVSWESALSQEGSLLLMRGTDTLGIYSDKKKTFRHSIPLSGLEPNTTYHISVSPTLRTIPAHSAAPAFFPFTTTAGRLYKQYARLPIAVVLFTNVQSPDEPVQPARAASADSEISRVTRQLADAARFYWIHSGMRLFLDLDTVVVRGKVRREDLFGTESWYPPRESVLVQTLAARGRDLKNYDGVLYLSFSQTYDTLLRHYVLAGKGGAFTNGVGTGKGYGISWWDVTRANHNAGNNWLMVHEFNHQLDDIFMVSGYPEYWFNHISPTIGTAGNFGEHFDANAAIIRMVPPEEWLDLRYTRRALFRDADGDGIPDNDPRLPLDEVRLGSDSTSRDSDGDGVSDFDELARSNWITEGWGETYAQAIFPNLHAADTDHDGIADDVDSLPCSPIAPVIHKGTAFTEGVPPFATLLDPRIHATVRTGWTADSLSFLISMDRFVPVKIMLDGSGDGWFLGRDNFQITLTPVESTSTVIIKSQLLDGTDPARWPFGNDSLAGRLQPVAFLSRRGGSIELRCTVYPNAEAGVSFREQRRAGLLIGFQVVCDADGSRRFLDLWEPNRLLPVTYQK